MPELPLPNPSDGIPRLRTHARFAATSPIRIERQCLPQAHTLLTMPP
jgi:hypothetical protein